MENNGRKESITIYLLKKGVDNKTLNRLKHNENITALTIEKLCIILECTPNDVLTFTNE